MHDKPNDNERWMVRETAPKYVPGDPGEEWITAADFKARCLQLIEQVREGPGKIVITRYGKPVARLIPYEEKPVSIFGHLSGTIVSHGDLVSPIDETWEADV